MKLLNKKWIEITNDLNRKFSNLKKSSSKLKKISSQKWLQRQIKDPFVRKAKIDGYVSRAAYKLIEINEKYKIISTGSKVIDLGCAPGGWTQVAVNIVKKCHSNTNSNKGFVLGIDIVDFKKIAEVDTIIGDFRQNDVLEKINTFINNKEKNNNNKYNNAYVDVILSDMAPSFSGNSMRDNERQLQLCENALLFASIYLKNGGNFVTKIFQCGKDIEFRNTMKKQFDSVKITKPDSSRNESREIYLIGKNYKREID